jgi:hypothetical protein
VKQPGLRSVLLGDDMTTEHQMIRKIMASAAIALGFCLLAAAPANAEPNPASTDPNPFGTLGCSCRETAPAGSQALTAEIDRGIQEGRSAMLPGLPPPPSQPQR